MYYRKSILYITYKNYTVYGRKTQQLNDFEMVHLKCVYLMDYITISFTSTEYCIKYSSHVIFGVN